MARLLSVNVGLPSDIVWQGGTVNTAIWKTPVVGPRMARRLNIDGDGQADLAGHGGERPAVFERKAALEQGRKELFNPCCKSYLETFREQA